MKNFIGVTNSNKNLKIKYLVEDKMVEQEEDRVKWLSDLPIDLVYTWVDGSDPAWSASKAFYQRKKKLNHYQVEKIRFLNLDELRYSLRSVLKFAPFIRKIFIVTSGQEPKFLDLTVINQEDRRIRESQDGRLVLIPHSVIFRPEEQTWALPTFNSIAIESNLHRIPGLSEYFIYFNDDVFFGRPVLKEYFVKYSGRSAIFLRKDSPVPDRSGLVGGKHNYYYKDGLYLTHKYLNKHVKKRSNRMTRGHVGIVLRKSVMEQVEAQLRKTGDWEKTLTRFRQNQNIKVVSLFYDYFLKDEVKMATRDPRVKFLQISVNHSTAYQKISKGKYHMFCLNSLPNRDTKLMKLFNHLYPEKAPYEK